MPRGHRKTPPATRASEALADFETALNEYSDCNQLRAATVKVKTMARTVDMVAATYKLAGVLCLKRHLPVLDIIRRVRGVMTATKVGPRWAALTRPQRRIWKEGVRHLRGLGQRY